MDIILKKQPQKYLAAVPENIRQKLYRGIDDIRELRGDIVRLAGYDNMYRYKIAHYRILFSIDKQGQIVIIETINTRTNIKY